MNEFVDLAKINKKFQLKKFNVLSIIARLYS